MDKLIPSKESLTVEFKSDKKKLSDETLIDSVVAFANTEGGDLYLGVEDNGHVSGRHESHKDFAQLSAFIANKTIPPVSVRVEQIEAELPVIKISVPKSRSIVASSSGKIQRRPCGRQPDLLLSGWKSDHVDAGPCVGGRKTDILPGPLAGDSDTLSGGFTGQVSLSVMFGWTLQTNGRRASSAGTETGWTQTVSKNAGALEPICDRPGRKR